MALHAAAQRRAVLGRALCCLPVAAVSVALAYRYSGAASAVLAGVAVSMASAQLMRRAVEPYDTRWFLRRLNAAQPAFEDSLDLLQGTMPAPGHLAMLQRARLERRLREVVLPDLRPAYPRWHMGLAWGGALLAWMFGVVVPAVRPEVWRAAWAGAAFHRGLASPVPSESAMIGAVLDVMPPPYTGLAAQRVQTFDAMVPEGSRVAFALHLPPATSAAALEFQGAGHLELRRDAEVWRGEQVVAASTLYRLAAPTAAGRSYRLDVIPDRAPEITVQKPARTLIPLADGQRTWDLEVEASDDYGLGAAELSITLAQGSGENVKTTRRTMPLVGDGDSRHRRYRHTVDLVALGFAEGDDLVVRFSVVDNRPGTPNRTESPSFILRWPVAAAAAGEGMDGLAQKTLPAYFASERQLILDTEALVGARPSMTPDRFAARADELGVEQKSLRMRYGEFLGEQSERSAEQDEDTTTPNARGVFGDAGTVTSEYGHVHDKPEAATLHGADTRRLLKAALDQMWQAEGELRVVDPQAALRFEYQALAFVKEVQQAERIYLARAGVQLPQVDANRRLTGDRKGLTDQSAALPAMPPENGPVTVAWRTLEAGGIPDVAALDAWARAHPAALPNALDLTAAADRLQREPACETCRAALAAALWPFMPQPPTAVQPREQPDASGAAYLEALGAHP
jgi:hypothetical protein